ncbi:MAG: lipid-A-disaccharide synthase [Pseudomonadota bacterium]
MKVFLVAGEPSGDRLGGALMGGLRALRPDVRFEGVGGPEMAAQGLQSLFDMSELSVMGLAEVLPRYPHLVRRMKETADRAVAMEPDVIVTIDSPDFGLRVLKRVRAARPAQRTVHYVSPTVWAWRPRRVDKMKGLVDQVLTLFPFEPPHLEAAGLRADFVGHPVATEPRAGPAETEAFRNAHGLGDASVMLVLPGSRKGEVSRLAPVFGAAIRAVLSARPDARIVVPAALPVAGMVTEAVRTWPGSPVILDPRGRPLDETLAEKRAAFAAANVALAASGTVSLELAAQSTPMVIAYDMAWISRQIIKSMLRVDTVTLVNLVSGTRTVPEFLGAACKPQPISDALTDLLADGSTQRDALEATMDRLGRGGEAPGLRAARAVLDGLGQDPRIPGAA